MSNQLQTDLVRVKAEYYADAFLILQRGELPTDPYADYFRVLSTLKYLIRMDEGNPIIQLIAERYDLDLTLI